MACNTCSKIRCQLFALVSGKPIVFLYDGCGNNCIEVEYDPKPYKATFTRVTNHDLGKTWKSLPKYIKTLGKALVARIRSK